MYDVVVKKVHVRYLISWWVSCFSGCEVASQLSCHCCGYSNFSPSTIRIAPPFFHVSESQVYRLYRGRYYTPYNVTSHVSFCRILTCVHVGYHISNNNISTTLEHNSGQVCQVYFVVKVQTLLDVMHSLNVFSGCIRAPNSRCQFYWPTFSSTYDNFPDHKI